jgi:hypothetical protein
MPFDNIYRLDRQGRKGQSCRILACGTMNTCLVEFADGFRMVTTDSALGKKRHESGSSTYPANRTAASTIGTPGTACARPIPVIESTRV